ncbi:MAG: methyltransferase domain-containing protein [Bacteroidetes bacterium]|nr:MAG: methyltransferase domain-containing protein [Bacteroidota bacterium]
MKKSKPKSPARGHSEDHLGEAREYWWNDDFLDLLAHRLDLSNCHQLADIGCGKGLMSFRLAPFLAEGAEVYGIDREARYIKAAQQRVKREKTDNKVSFQFAEGDALTLPFEDDSMDLTMCQTLLIHVRDPQAVIAEMKRVTRPGGLVVAFEPNNLAPHLMFDRYIETDYSVEEVLEMVEVRLRCEKGKKRLGEGFSSLGDVLPDLFLKAGLEDQQVWMSDKAMPIIPPYETREMRVRVAQLIEWIENGEGGFGYEENLRYYLAGGGRKDDFASYWYRVSLYKLSMLQKLKSQQFISAGGSVMYIVTGRVT